MSPEAPVGASAVQIPGVIREFLNRATVALAGTRDRDLVPRARKVSGWRVEPDGETIACMIPEAHTSKLAESLEDNGQFTLTIEEIGPHETYQFKGVFVDAEPCTSVDLEIAQRVSDRFTKVVPPLFGLSEAFCRAFNMRPDLTVRFRVREIYVQTPGPGAGRRLVPPEEK